jgi:hypothetical protein
MMRGSVWSRDGELEPARSRGIRPISRILVDSEADGRLDAPSAAAIQSRDRTTHAEWREEDHGYEGAKKTHLSITTQQMRQVRY